MPHLLEESTVLAWPDFTPERPLRILTSGCLAGRRCGVDGSTYGEHPIAAALLALPNVRAVDFCPEDFAFGTPRDTPNLYGGDGFDALDGRARVLTDAGDDWTAGMLRAAHIMLERAQAHDVRLALLMDVSAACGSQVIYDGPRHLRTYRAGPGVAAALLIRAGIPVVSQRDLRTLGFISERLGRPDLAPPGGRDHHESDWYRQYFR
ncbi:MAG TPA: DUF523 domain-containing protein [Polyangiaceae bacterium]|jgi:uncharacterized protein YbbK (DUF523 family)|nr:DUF523 domain-containing protein [Polyangiaceae bacterium]